MNAKNPYDCKYLRPAGGCTGVGIVAIVPDDLDPGCVPFERHIRVVTALDQHAVLTKRKCLN